MADSRLTTADIVAMTREVGESWAVAHAERLLALVEVIGAEVPHDPEVLQIAAYVHDWGAFPAHRQPGVEHAERSREVVAAQLLPRLDLSVEQAGTLLEAIALHDYRDRREPGSGEALLLREADMLDFLGAIGIARDFARGPKDLPPSVRTIQERHDTIRGRLTLPEARRIAVIRDAHAQAFLAALDEDGMGHL